MSSSDSKDLLSEATNQETSRERLDELSKSKQRTVREAVARNSSTSPQTLEFLGQDELSDVRKAVAENPATPRNTLDRLSRDNFAYIKEMVVNNPSTPLEAHLRLVKDKSIVSWSSYFTLLRLAQGKETPKSVLQQLAAAGPGLAVAVASNHSIDSELFREFLSGYDPQAKCAAFLNPSCPSGLKQEMESLYSLSTEQVIEIANDLLNCEVDEVLKEWSVSSEQRFEKYKERVQSSTKRKFEDDEIEQVALLADLYIVFKNVEISDEVVRNVSPEELLRGLAVSGWFLNLEDWTFNRTLLNEGYARDGFNWFDTYTQSLEAIGAISWINDLKEET